MVLELASNSGSSWLVEPTQVGDWPCTYSLLLFDYQAETKAITHRSAAEGGADPETPHGKEIRMALHSDSRWFELNGAADEREAMLCEILAELERKGPPPPPTSSTDATWR